MTTLKVLGTGCKKCKTVQANAEKAIRELGLDVQVEKVTDMQEIMQFQVMSTPGLVVDGEVRSTGRVPSTEEIKQMLAGEAEGRD